MSEWTATQRNSRTLWTVLLLAAVAVAYSPALNNGFIYDDVGLIVHRALHLKGWGGLRMLLSHGFWWDVPEATSKTYLFRPWLTATFWISAQFGDISPIVFHLSGCLAQIALTALLIRLFSPLLGFFPAFAIAAISGLSPAALSSVGMISAQADVWALLFIVAFLISFRSYRDSSKPWHLAAANASFLLALASKEIAIIAPVLAWLLDYFAPAKKALPGRWKSYASLLIPLAVFWVWRHQAIAGAVSDRVNLHFAGRMFPYLAEKIIRSAAHIVAPIHYALYSEYLWSLPGHRGLLFGMAWVLLLAMLAVLFVGFRKKALWALGGLWFLIFVLPIYIFGQGFAPISDFYVYGGIPGLWLCVYAGVSHFGTSRKFDENRLRRISVYGALGIAAIFGILTFVRLPILRSEYSLSAQMAEREPKSVMALSQMTNACLQSGDSARALDYAERTVKIEPAAIDAQKFIADHYLEKGDARAAAPFVDALSEYGANDIECQGTIANFYYVAGHCTEAVQTYENSLPLGTPSDQFSYNYGLALLCAGNPAKAKVIYSKLISKNSRFVRAYYQLGTCYERLNQWDDALEAYRKTTQIDSSYFDGWASLASAYIKLGRMSEARHAARRCYELNPLSLQADSLLAITRQN